MSWRCFNSRLGSVGIKRISTSIMFHLHSDSRILWLKHGRLAWFLFIFKRANQRWLVLKHTFISNIKSVPVLLLIPLFLLNIPLNVAQIVILFHLKLHLFIRLLLLFLSSIKVKILQIVLSDALVFNSIPVQRKMSFWYSLLLFSYFDLACQEIHLLILFHLIKVLLSEL